MKTKPLLAFMSERIQIKIRRAAGQPPPWTKDKILQTYRFCNVYRNWDRQTLLFHRHWLHKHAGAPSPWFAMCVARMVNWWPTLEEAGYPIPWEPEKFVKALNARKDRGEKVFTGAYVISATTCVDGSKINYVANQVLTPIWLQRRYINPHKGDTLDTFHQRLMEFNGMGSFMAAQVVADVKYDSRSHLRGAPDWATWAASGPGSRRGLNRVLEREVDAPWTEGEWRESFRELLGLVVEHHEITGQDLQNCLCEFDKYERVRLGQGAPRSLFRPTKD